jgi:hypothetical protein
MAFDPGRPTTNEHLPYFSRYIDLVPDVLEGCVVAQLEHGFAHSLAVLSILTPAQAQHRYATDKWSVLEVVGHLCDSERVFAYRALHCARHDQSPLPGFDQDAWSHYTNYQGRDLASVLAEWQSVRQASIALFTHLQPMAWLYQTSISNHPMSARACAYIIAGHELYHQKLLQERYGIEF